MGVVPTRGESPGGGHGGTPDHFLRSGLLRFLSPQSCRCIHWMNVIYFQKGNRGDHNITTKEVIVPILGLYLIVNYQLLSYLEAGYKSIILGECKAANQANYGHPL